MKTIRFLTGLHYTEFHGSATCGWIGLLQTDDGLIRVCLISDSESVRMVYISSEKHPATNKNVAVVQSWLRSSDWYYSQTKRNLPNTEIHAITQILHLMEWESEVSWYRSTSPLTIDL